MGPVHQLPKGLPDFITLDEIASHLRVPLATVRGWAHRRVIPRPAKHGLYGPLYRTADVQASLQAARGPHPIVHHRSASAPRGQDNQGGVLACEPGFGWTVRR